MLLTFILFYAMLCTMRTICITLDDEILDRVDATARSLMGSRSYAARRLLASALSLPGGDLHAAPGSTGRPRRSAGRAAGGDIYSDAAAPSARAVAGADSSSAPSAPGGSSAPGALSFSTETTMRFQTDHDARQRATRKREATARDEALAMADAMTEAARRDGTREAAEIEERHRAALERGGDR